MQAILEAPDEKTARMLLGKPTSFYEDKSPKAMSIFESGFDYASEALSSPKEYRQGLRTTNSIESLNKEIEKRERVIRILSNRESVICLIGALLMVKDEKWTTGKKYFDMEEYSARHESQISGQTQKVPSLYF